MLPLFRNPKTCFKFPLDGRAFVENLHKYTSRRRKSHLVIRVSLKDFPWSNVPNGSFNTENKHRQIITVAIGRYYSIIERTFIDINK